MEKLNDDHTLENPEEVQRLASLGLPMESIRNSTKFGHQLYTRCIGDYSVKGGYKDNEQMRCVIVLLQKFYFSFRSKRNLDNHGW